MLLLVHSRSRGTADSSPFIAVSCMLNLVGLRFLAHFCDVFMNINNGSIYRSLQAGGMIFFLGIFDEQKMDPDGSRWHP